MFDLRGSLKGCIVAVAGYPGSRARGQSAYRGAAERSGGFLEQAASHEGGPAFQGELRTAAVCNDHGVTSVPIGQSVSVDFASQS